ncbi:hypothetical protein [Actinokineospora sp. HUAS TT18]|uniref:hypothetical protein n=1 Tax=Actinokineospora sp. HUAS TT18 TaxID=3447451 RepID=UPI003F51B031
MPGTDGHHQGGQGGQQGGGTQAAGGGQGGGPGTGGNGSGGNGSGGDQGSAHGGQGNGHGSGGGNGTGNGGQGSGGHGSGDQGSAHGGQGNGHGSGGGQGNGHGSGGHGGDSHLLDLDPQAVPALRSAFVAALDQIDRQLEAAGELPVAAWANDPVSLHAADVVNALSVDSDVAAVDALRSFRRQLGTAVDNLDKIADQYRVLEDDAEATVSQTGQG